MRISRGRRRERETSYDTGAGGARIPRYVLRSVKCKVNAIDARDPSVDLLIDRVDTLNSSWKLQPAECDESHDETASGAGHCHAPATAETAAGRLGLGLGVAGQPGGHTVVSST